MRGFITALEFLTRVRFSNRKEWHNEDFGRSVLWFPVIGLFGGAVLCAVNWQLTLLNVPNLLRAVLLIVVELFFFGGLMYDGYMDTCDGVFSARDRERMLEIMKDSHVGANAVLGVGILLLLKLSLFATLEPMQLSLGVLFAYVLTRTLMAFYIVAYPNPRNNGIGKMFKDYAKTWYPLLGVMILGILVYEFGWFYGAGTLGTFVIMNLWALYLKNVLGGLTGDTFGFLTEVGVVVYLLCIYVINYAYLY